MPTTEAAVPTAEQLEIQSLAHEFAETELRPRSAGWDERSALDEQVFGALAELGFLGMLVPEEHGGLGFDLPTYVRVLEELAWGDAAVALCVAMHNGPVAALLGRHGREEQRARWLPRLASGDVLGALALAERGGTHPGRLATTARPHEGGWRLDGEKRWVTQGARAGLTLVLARAGEDAAAFLVEPGARGLHVGERARTLGLRAAEAADLELRGVTLAADARLGAEGTGRALPHEALDLERLAAAALAIGVARAAMEHASAYALGRRQFGTTIASFGAIREKVAVMAQRIAAARALTAEAAEVLQAAWSGAEPEPGLGGPSARIALAKLTASDAAVWAADEAIQVFGGYGYMRHYPVEKLLRDAKGIEIQGGTNDLTRELVAREVLGEPAEPAEEPR